MKIRPVEAELFHAVNGTDGQTDMAKRQSLIPVSRMGLKSDLK